MSPPDRKDEPPQNPGATHAEWTAHARRVAPLADGVEYFRSVRRSLIAARKQVFLLGWELHSEIDLLRGEEAARAADEEEHPVRLADLLLNLVDRHSSLHVRLLIWEGASLFSLERQHLPRMKRPWADHPRITLVWDRDTPRMGSQHQKLVVIDDRVAYAGGMDLTKSRWDDHAHRPGDERRRSPGLIGKLGGPYHDLMLAVDGDAARQLGDWARERWKRATGSKVSPPDGETEHPAPDPWPEGVDPLVTDTEVAIALTQPDFGGRPEKRQVESSYLAQIAEARRLIFIETQYFTARQIADALVERLRDPGGPEVILVLPYGCEGKIQAMALDPQRDALLDDLRAADAHDRLGVYWPTLDGGAPDDIVDRSVYVHAKTMVVDDRLLRIGSANLNSRSMGLDTELDVFTQVEGEDAERSVAGYRRRLLAYLLHVEPDEVEREEKETGSVLAAIESLRGGSRTLHPFEHRASRFAHTISIPIELADPDRPLEDVDADRLLRAIEADKGIAERVQRGVNAVVGAARRSAGLIVVLVVAVALAAVWTFTPLSDLVDRASVREAVDAIRSNPFGVVGIVAGFVVLATAGAPVTLLIGVVGSMFGLGWAIPVCLVGVTASALAGFGIGRVLPFAIGGADEGGRLDRVRARLSDHGVLAVTILRNLPIAPFAVVNVACGMTSIAWWKYTVGTVLGMLPGIVLIGIFGSEIGGLLAEPTVTGMLRIVGVAALVIVTAIGADAVLRRWRRGDGEDEESQDE